MTRKKTPAPSSDSEDGALLTAERMVVAYQAPTVLIAVIGLGGTGSWVAAHLVHQVWHFNRQWNRALTPRQASLLLVDYDLVERANVEARQNFYPFEVGHPKAQVLANRFQLGFNLRAEDIRAVVAPFSPALIPHTREDLLVILVGCVDTTEARRSIGSVLESQATPSPIWWVDAGNERDFGQVLCGNTAKEADLVGSLAGQPGLALPSPALLAQALVEVPAEPPEPGARSFACGAVQVEGVPAQSDTINFSLAGTVATYVHRLLTGGLHTFATYVNLERSIETRSECICARALAHALGHQEDAESFARSLVVPPVTRSPRKKSS